ncbi:hypothetical protein [Reyranella sp.]|uniref:hypothetical protein n=1 Tax=Reyranella sp. TaxID=1929291 RepID=UPI002727B40C|nr:hypothetical protein [Reyranella sp.]MDO8975426.1 hypothetical protein [Reyranella sp.]
MQAGLPALDCPLESLFEEPRFNLPKDRLQQLDTLRRIRNNILHGFETLVDPVEVAAFDRAAPWFDPANIEAEKLVKDEVSTCDQEGSNDGL